MRAPLLTDGAVAESRLAMSDAQADVEGVSKAANTP